MLKLEEIASSKLKPFNLFQNSDPYASFIPVLADAAGRVLSGGLPDSETLMRVFVLSSPETQGKEILNHREQFYRKKLSFKEKFYFLKNFSQTYPDASFILILSWIAFPEALREEILWFLNLPESDFDFFLNQGLTSLREVEYLFALKETGFLSCLKKSGLSGNRFKMTVNMAFESFRLGLLSQIASNLNPQELEALLTRIRYPRFFEKLSAYETHLKKIPGPSFIKLQTPPFFEGRKLQIILELKNSRQWEESLNFFQQSGNQIQELLNFLQSPG